MEIAAFALGIITNLVSTVIEAGISYSMLDFFQQRRIRNRIDDAIAEVVEHLLPFLNSEGLSQEQQRLLLQTCVDELRPLTAQPELLFRGSLDGQRIVEELYAHGKLPEQIIEEGVTGIYTLLCTRVATLLCKIPAAVKDWENQAWSENYRRLDNIASEISSVIEAVDNLAELSSQQADETLKMARRLLAQKVRFDLDLTGLRGDRPFQGRFEDFFVHPAITEPPRSKGGTTRTLETEEESFEQVLQPGTSAIVVGSPGGGKSTWAKWLQRKALSNDWDGLCIRLDLRRFASEQPMSLYDLVRDSIGTMMTEELSQDRIRQWIDAQKLIFVLDGFDEIPLNSREKIFEWITDLRVVIQQCPLVLTSRLLTTDHLERLRPSWQYWEIQPFNEQRVIRYIERWYAHTPLLSDSNREIDAVELAENWSADETIAPLTGNPLLLSTLLMVHHLDGRLPSGRSQLYRRYVDGMLGLWDDRRQISSSSVPLSLEHKRLILRNLALRMFLNELDQLEEAMIEQWMVEHLAENKISLAVDVVLTILRERSGLIVGPGIYSFVHKSVAEYLVAETIHQGDQRDVHGERIDRLHLFQHRDEDRWNTVTFLWSGIAPVADIEEFIEACFEADSRELAFGVLLDQYERIPKDTRRQLILKGINRNPPLIFAKDTLRWHAPGPKDGAKTYVPHFRLRGLIPYPNFSNLLLMSVEDGTITWTDCESLTGDIRTLLWMTFYVNPRDLDSWHATINSPCDECISSLNCMYVLTFWLFGYLVSNESLDPSAFVIYYRNSLPQYFRMLPIIIMSIVYSMMAVSSRRSHTTDNVIKMLSLLTFWQPDELDPEMLYFAKHWDLQQEHGPQDLLQSLTRVIEDQLLASNNESDIEILEQGRAIIKDAINFRDSMAQPAIVTLSGLFDDDLLR